MAIATVLIYHTFYVFANVPTGSVAAYALSLTRLWWNGVDLFFVLSGFLIGGILLDARDSQSYFRTFYARRAFRILPLYFAVLGAVAVTSSFLPPMGDTYPALAYVLLLQNFWAARAGDFGMVWLSCTWSLAIEEQFYLVAPALVRFLKPRSIAIVAGAVIAGAPIARIVLYNGIEKGAFASHVLMFTRADILMFGVAAALVVRNQRIVAKLDRWRMLLPGLGILSAALLILFTARDWTIGSFQMTAFGYSIQGVLFSTVLLHAVLRSNGMLARILSHSSLGYLGRRAYGIYLFHVPAIYLVFLIAKDAAPDLRSASDFLLALLAVTAAVLTAAISWRYLERPLVQRGHSWRY